MLPKIVVTYKMLPSSPAGVKQNLCAWLGCRPGFRAANSTLHASSCASSLGWRLPWWKVEWNVGRNRYLNTTWGNQFVRCWGKFWWKSLDQDQSWWFPACWCTNGLMVWMIAMKIWIFLEDLYPQNPRQTKCVRHINLGAQKKISPKTTKSHIIFPKNNKSPKNPSPRDVSHVGPLKQRKNTEALCHQLPHGQGQLEGVQPSVLVLVLLPQGPQDLNGATGVKHRNTGLFGLGFLETQNKEEPTVLVGILNQNKHDEWVLKKINSYRFE